MASNPNRLPPLVEAVTGTEGLELNGQRVDLRTRTGRQWRDHIRKLANQLGGKPTASQGLILRRVATLALMLERAEAELLETGKIDEPGYRANTDKLKACLIQLGLAQKSRDVKGSDNQPIDDHAATILGG